MWSSSHPVRCTTVRGYPRAAAAKADVVEPSPAFGRVDKVEDRGLRGRDGDRATVGVVLLNSAASSIGAADELQTVGADPAVPQESRRHDLEHHRHLM